MLADIDGVARRYRVQRFVTGGSVVSEAADRVTRLAADLVDSAEAEGVRQSRSAKQQLDHWVRVGRAVSSQQTASRRRVEAAMAGQLPLRDLTVEEGVVFNAESRRGSRRVSPAPNTVTSSPPAGSPRWRSTTTATSSNTFRTAHRSC